MCEYLGGLQYARAMNFIMSVLLLGVLISSFIVVHDVVGTLLSPPVVAPTTPTPAPTPSSTANDDEKFAIYAVSCVGLLVVLPLSLPRNIGLLAYASFFSMATFSFFVAYIVILGVRELGKSDFKKLVLWDTSLFLDNLGEIMPVMCYTFACQVQALDIYQSVASKLPPALKRRPAKSFFPVILGGVSLMMVLFTMTGFFGLCAFSSTLVKSDATTQSQLNSPLGSIARAALGVAISCSMPLLVFPIRAQIVFLCTARKAPSANDSMSVAPETPNTTVRSMMPPKLWASSPLLINKNRKDKGPAGGPDIGGDSEKGIMSSQAVIVPKKPLPFSLHFLLTLSIVGLAIFLSLELKDITIVFRALGSFICAPLFFIFPALVLLYLKWSQLPTGQHKSAEILMCLYLIGIGLAISILSARQFLLPASTDAPTPSPTSNSSSFVSSFLTQYH